MKALRTFPAPVIADPENPTLGEATAVTAHLFAVIKRDYGLAESTIMDILRNNMIFMQQDSNPVEELTATEETETAEEAE